MGTVVELVGSISYFESLGVADFDAEVTMDIFGNLDGTICGLFFELFCNVVGDVSTRCLRMTKVIEAEASMLLVVLFNTREGGCTNCRTV